MGKREMIKVENEARRATNLLESPLLGRKRIKTAPIKGKSQSQVKIPTCI
jgi:hypothetical protein